MHALRRDTEPDTQSEFERSRFDLNFVPSQRRMPSQFRIRAYIVHALMFLAGIRDYLHWSILQLMAIYLSSSPSVAKYPRAE